MATDGSSVGKISLDIELGGNIKEQIRTAAGEIGKGIEETITGQNLDMTGITKGVEKALSGMELAFRASFDDIRTMASDVAQYIRDTMASAGNFSVRGPQSVDLPSTASINPSSMATGPPVRIKAPTIAPDVGAIKMQMEQLDGVLASLDAKAYGVRQKMNALKAQIASLSRPTGNPVQDFINTDSLTRARAELQALEAEHEKIGTKVTAINDKYIKMENAVRAINTPTAAVTVETTKMAAAAGAIKPPLDRAAASATMLKTAVLATTSPLKAVATSIQRIGSSTIERASAAMAGLRARAAWAEASIRKIAMASVYGLRGMARSIISTMKNLLILGVIAAGLRSAMGIFSYGASQTVGFEAAVLRLKTAFYTAMYPIYTAVMPALITFINGLASVINYLAVFISMLTGSTYQASFKGAKALQAGAAAAEYQKTAMQGASKAVDGTKAAVDKASKAMDGASDASKTMADDVKKSVNEAKRALAGFDEINVLSFPEDPAVDAPTVPDVGGGGAGGIGDIPVNPMDGFVAPDFGAPFAGIPGAVAAVTPILNGLKDLFNTLFDPLKSAWDKQGPVFMAALNDAITATKQIFTDLYKVLQSPPVQAFMDKMWQIAILIGAVALRVYADFIAPLINWFVNSIPVAAEALNPVLDKIITRLEALAAPGFGSAALANIIPALDRLRDALLPFTVTMAEGLLWIYDYVLLPLTTFLFTDVVPRVIELLANSFTLLNDVAVTLQPLWQWLWDNLFAPIAAWTGGVFLTVLDGINAALKVIGDWIVNNRQTIENIIITVGAFAVAWKLVNAAILIWNVAAAIATGVTGGLAVAAGLLGTAIAFITSPIGIAVIVIGTLIAVGILLWRNWDTVKLNLTNIWNAIKTTASNVWNGIKTFFSNTWNSIKTTASNVWNGIKTFFSNTWTGIKTTASNVFTAIRTFLSNTWTGIKTTISNVWNGIKSFFSNTITAIKTKVLSVIANLVLNMALKWTAAKNKATEMFGNIKTAISEKITAAKTTVLGVVELIKNSISDKFQAAKDKVSEIFDNIKTSISQKINAAKNTVSSIIDKIKGFFDFKFSWPKMPMPHFGVTPEGWKIGDLLKGSIPKLGINWYARGGEFDQPSVIGVGENGREAVVPLEHNTSWARDVAELITSAMGGGSGEGQAIRMVIDEREVGRAILRDWNRAERQSGKATTLKR